MPKPNFEFADDRQRFLGLTGFKAYMRKDADTGEEQQIIEGFGSTDAVDDYNEVVEAESFREWLPWFLEFPTVCFNHELFYELPIGKVLKAEIREHGLWVEVLVSKSAPKVWQLIKEGILKAFSIGFGGLEFKKDDTDGARPALTWTKIKLVELSVVTLPAQREALFAVAASKGIDLGSLFSNPQDAKGAGIMPPEVVTKADVTKIVSTEIKDTAANLETIATDAGAAAAKSATDAISKTMDQRAADFGRDVKALQEALANAATKAEFTEAVDKIKADLMPVIEHMQRNAQPMLQNVGLEFLYDKRDMAASYLEKSIAREHSRELLHIRSLINLPEQVLRKGDDRAELMEDFQFASDNLYILHNMAQIALGSAYGGIRSLKYWSEYKRIESEFRKAMDTATATEGLEWVPTNFSAQLHAEVTQLGELSGLFDQFTMPTKVYEWPIQVSRATAYLMPESISDAAEAVPASTPGTGQTTFTAKKLMARVLTSREFEEDSIIAALQFIRTEIAMQFARAREDTILNGDTAAPHQDVDVTNAKDHRKAWLGLRAYALDNSYGTDTSTFALADLRTIRGTLGKYGVHPKNLAYILSPTIYITKFLADSDITTMEKAGARATWLQGEADSVDGAPIRVSEFQREDLNASGIFDDATETKSAITVVYRPGWKLGVRRNATMVAELLAATDQMQIVSTMREDYEAMHGTDAVTALGYNVS